MLKNQAPHYFVGIDEVGRGALAGPVTVAAIVLSRNFQIPISNFQIISNSQFRNSKPKLRDSKKLSATQREEWFKFLRKSVSSPRKSAICYAVANVSPNVIDRINIARAANLAATRALKKLLATSHWGLATRVNIFLDGGLHVNVKTLVASGYTLNPRTIIKGDEKIPVIALASIVAKVTRDRLMKKLHRKYPRYDFINNVGYGTKKHIKAIRKFRLTPIHRITFTKNLKLKT